MAKNLRQKLPSDDTLIVEDINKDASRKFADELKSFQVVVADSPREVAEKAVCKISFRWTYCIMMNLFPREMI